MSTEIENKLSQAEANIKHATDIMAEIRKTLANDKSISPKVDLDKIHTWEDVAAAFGIHPVNSLPRPEPKDDDEENDNAYFMAKRIVKLFNADPKFPNYDNSDNKYNPVFNMGSSGVGFSSSLFVSWNSVSNVGARLSWKNRQTMEEIITKRFPKVWEKLMK